MFSSGDNDNPWINGIAFPILLIGYGIACIATQSAVMTGRGYIFYTRMSIQGGTAIAYGLASIAIGLFLHFHAIWAESVRLSRYADAGRIISMLLFIVSLSYVIWHIGMFNR